MSAYSGTPLAKKLGIKEGNAVIFHNVPDYYFNLFEDFPAEIELLEEPLKESTDFIHLFITTIEEMERLIPIYKNALKKSGMLWVSWPKGSSSIPTDLKREPLRVYILSKGLVDVKVASIDDDWSAARFVYRLKDR